MVVKRSALLALAVVLLFVGGLSLLSGISTVDVQMAAPTPAVGTPTEETPLCEMQSDTFTNYATWRSTTKEKPWSFGPPSITNVRDGHTPFAPITKAPELNQTTNELITRLCGYVSEEGYPVGGDDALYRALMSAADDSNPNYAFTLRQWRESVKTFVNERLQFDQARIEWRAHEEAYSFFMEPVPNAVHIGISKVHNAGWYYIIPLKLQNGTVRTLSLRLDCGFQPAFWSLGEIPSTLSHLLI
ncbi:MAG TPA: hypothetical protein VD907_04390 [Verrucomicrobiae bacterium]|nr:hypothetical protein [Verrucomicrobiae bacterium]